MASLLDILKQFNWVDIFFAILLIRICYVAVKNGFPVELFKFLGTLLAAYLSLHYYTNLSDYITSYNATKALSIEYVSVISFIALVILGYIILALLGRLFSRFLKMEAAPKLNKWGGFILGIARSFLLMSLVIFVFLISSSQYLMHSVDNSYSGKYLFKIAPTAYTWLWDNVMSKFRPQEKFNSVVLKAYPSEK